jgi:AraC-like DNA-binding protein
MIWYIRAPDLSPYRERVLPGGCVQIVINLDRLFNWECSDLGRTNRLPGSLVVGARSVYEVIDTADMADMLGILFHPGGFAPFAGDAVDLFSNRNVCLRDAWGATGCALRERLLDAADGTAKLALAEEFLWERFAAKLRRNALVDFALCRFAANPSVSAVGDVARDTGRSQRYLSQIFREHVGVTPKTWCRIQRFQRAVQQLHAGAEVPWAEMALECGYYDQSHFANEFRAFSGIDATTYSVQKGRWANHVPIEPGTPNPGLSS